MFGQSGSSVGSGWDVFDQVLDTAGQIFGPGGIFGQAPAQAPWPAPGVMQPFLPAVVPPLVQGTIGGLAGGALAEILPALLGGNGNGAMEGQLFKAPTASMKPRPVNKVQVMGPDGKCHTWLHATPKGWKVNATNVSGRRRHHHHPR